VWRITHPYPNLPLEGEGEREHEQVRRHLNDSFGGTGMILSGTALESLLPLQGEGWDGDGADRYGGSEHQSSRMEKEEAEDAFISLHA